MRVKVRIVSGEPAAAAAAAEPEPVPAPISVPSIPKKRSIMRLDKATGQLVAQVPTPPIVAPTRRRSPDIAEVIAGDRSAMMLDLPHATPAQIERFEHRNDPKPKNPRRPNQWIEHVARVRAELPAGTSYSAILKTASKSYVGIRVPLTKKHAIKSIRTGPWDPDEVPIPPDAIVVRDGDVYVPSKREGKRGTLIRINKKNNLMERMALGGIDGGALGVLDEPGILIDLEGGALIERNWNDQARRILDGFGAWTIVAIRVQRAPVQAFVTGLLNTVTLGGYKAAMRSAGYDKMFHLGHVLTLRREPDGAMKRVILEKNEVVNLSDKIPTEKDMEFHDIGIPSPFKTLNEYVSTTLKAIGSGAFFLYDAQRRNCQRFIMDNLRANGILTDSATAFIQQEADGIFKRLPGLQQFARTLTDLGAAVAHVKDETIAVAKDVAKGAKIAAKSTVKQINKAAKKVGRLFGRGLVEDGLKIQSVLIDRSVPLDDLRRICERNGWTMEFGIDSKPGYHRVRQMDPALFKKGSFRTMDPDGSGPLKFIIGKLK